MGTEETTAEVFWTLFRRLFRTQRRLVVQRLLRDRAVREDLVDTAIIEQRKRELSRSLEAYLAKRVRKART